MQDAKISIIELFNSADICTISEAHQLFAEALRIDRPIEINIVEVMDADLTLIQLIESARKTAAQRGVPISLTEPAAGPVLQILQRGGFLTGDEDRSDFWSARQRNLI